MDMRSYFNTKSHSFLMTGITLLSMLAANVAYSATPPLVKIPNGPVSRSLTHPNLMLDLSVEYTSVGSAYKTEYSVSRSYYGYFNPRLCYDYTVKKPANFVGGVYDTSQDAKKYFVPVADATNDFKCNGKHFSGNYMNWVAASAIDMMRLALSGGNRVIDTPTQTVLERANLPPLLYGNLDHFPVKTLATTGTVKPSDVTPFNDATIYAVSCSNRVLFSTVKNTVGGEETDNKLCDSETNPTKNRGEYLVKVEVCSTKGEETSRADVCARYPNGGLKPVGDIQNNASQMRFAAMGYLLENGPYRYGGVLRAPMGYVGSKTFDQNLTESNNGQAEWDPNTGVFIKDPLGAGTKYSGVINYLNKFGSTGVYKTNDPVSELYYESLRYLRGVQPTPLATANMTEPMKDGFPVIQDWKDPITASCQRNTIMLVADAVTNFDFYLPGNVTQLKDVWSPTIVDGPRAADSDNLGTALNARDWTNKVGSLEVQYAPPSKITASLGDQRAGYKENAPGADGEQKGSYYISGLAYWANVNPIRNDAKKNVHVRTFVLDVDERGNGTMDDPTRQFEAPRESQLYLAAKYGGYQPYSTSDVRQEFPELNPYTPGPASTSAVPGCGSFLWDKFGNCKSDNFFLAGDGNAFVESIHKIISQVRLQGDSINLVSASGAVVTATTNQSIYQSFSTSEGGWAGDILRKEASFDGNLNVGAASADTALSSLYNAANLKPRNIYTLNKDPSLVATKSTVPFLWASLTADQQAALNAGDALGEQRLEFLRGSTSAEFSDTNVAGKFRQRPKIGNRTNVLGDIINSSPVYVGKPRTDISESGYQSFYDNNFKRAAAVYAGANDGMLHAFSADLKNEYFAYVPGMIFNRLHKLTDRNYVHENYVDGNIVVGEANTGAGNWKTVLVGAMGGGAQGVYALNVSKPDNFDAVNGALWEFSDADDEDMGNLTQAPSIAKFVTKFKSGAPDKYEYFAVVASGFNNFAADGHQSVNATNGALFLLSLEKKPGDKWKLGSNYFKFKPQLSLADTDTTTPNGLNMPALITGADGAVQAAYAGDLQGNLWQFSFANIGLSSVAARKIFTAKDTAGNRQPITTVPKVVFAPSVGYVVLFGTGKFIEDTDLTSRGQSSFYGIYDDPLIKTYSVKDRTELSQRKLDRAGSDDLLKITGNEFSYVDAANTTPGASGLKGWYFDFIKDGAGKNSGERSITSAQTAFGQVIFDTFLPPEDCDYGNSRSYVVNTLTGLADFSASGLPGSTSNDRFTGRKSTVGVLTSPLIFDTNRGEIKSTDALGKKLTPRSYSIVYPGVNGSQMKENKSVNLPGGRLSWREIMNYRELKNVPN
jgi:type IV pilus assembly protein PilY1